MAGDFSPLSVDSSAGGPRHAPPALVVAVAVGLASMDMPIPHVDSWQWTNWKFPRPVIAGDTLYARWTLTQKRAPVRGSKTSIVVWRVDVHTADGSVCAEGEVGASVFRSSSAPASAPAAQDAGPTPAAPASRRRRRGKRGATGEAPAPPAPVEQPHPPQQERGGGGRRRRRRRTSSGGGGGNGNQVGPAAATPASLPEPASAATAPAARANPNPLSRALKRLRRT